MVGVWTAKPPAPPPWLSRFGGCFEPFFWSLCFGQSLLRLVELASETVTGLLQLRFLAVASVHLSM